MNFKKITDTSCSNLEELIRLYDKYRQMQYDILKQYNLLLEDPKFDDLYVDITPLTHYLGYVEEDLNGSDKRSSTTDIIKEFKKLKESYLNIKAAYETKPKNPDTLLN